MRATDPKEKLHPAARRRILESVVGLVFVALAIFLYWQGVEGGTGHVVALAILTLGATFIRPEVVKTWAATVLPFVRSQDKKAAPK